MILPTKGITPQQSLLAIAGEVLRALDTNKSVSRLWDDFRVHSDPESTITFDWFILSLDLLYIFGLVDLHRGSISRTGMEITK